MFTFNVTYIKPAVAHQYTRI